MNQETSFSLEPITEATLTRLLEQSHNHLLELTLDLADSMLRKQYHADLSPLGWHLGHAAFIERYWIDEVLLGQFKETKPLHDLYFPERNKKETRSALLPEKSELLKFVKSSFQNSLEKLPQLMLEEPDDPLLANGYLAMFLIQHNYQHRETMLQVLQRVSLLEEPDVEDASTVVPRPPVRPTLKFGKTGTAIEATIGATHKISAFDNELPVHSIKLPPFRIAHTAVSNAEFIHFINSGGYGDASLWSQDGWTWQQIAHVNAPYHWRESRNGNWFAVTPLGATRLIADDAVTGINYYEAEAYARFAGCRLPHEFEWEYAARDDSFISGKAWEWCRNSFYPYPGYKAYPYDNYSSTWFDGSHISLRGGSAYTHTLIKRPSFRNFYTPEKRHTFSGVRLAQSI